MNSGLASAEVLRKTARVMVGVVDGAVEPVDALRPDLLKVLDTPFGDGRLHNRLFPTQLKARTDGEAIRAYVRHLGDRSPKTKQAYLRELELFLRWLVFVKRLSIADLMFEDLAEYRAFMAKPPASWIVAKRGRWTKDHPNWRPFQGPRTPQNIAYSMTILNSLFDWLTKKGWLITNVVDGNNWTRAQGDDGKKPVKYLTQDARDWIARWLALERDANAARLVESDLSGEALALLQDQVDLRRRQIDRYEHIFVMAYYLMLRRTDLEAITMGSFQEDAVKPGRWTWSAVRKRNKDFSAVVAAPAVEQMNRYRAAYGRPPLPAHDAVDADTSIVLALSGEHGIGGDRIYELFGDLFRGAAGLASRAGADGDRRARAAAELLGSATPHWVRHTGLTDLKRGGASGAVARDLAGHEDESTTNTYAHSDKDEQEAALALLTRPL